MKRWILVAIAALTMGAEGCVTPEEVIAECCEVLPQLPCLRVDGMIEAGEIAEWPCSCVGPGLISETDEPLPYPVAIP